MKTVLIDSDVNNQNFIEELKAVGFVIEAVESDPEKALSLICQKKPEVVFINVGLLTNTSFSGITLLNEIKNNDCYKVAISNYNDCSLAFLSAKCGAFHFISKTESNLNLDFLFFKIKENQKKELDFQTQNDIILDAAEIRTKNDKMRRCIETAKKIASVDSTVLISGESGTGKSYLAKIIHKESVRSNKSFIIVNCSTLTENLLESELFGHAKGSFTGANRDKIGRFELADGGTVFLDEIAEISYSVQTKLLRFLQEREFERVGETKTKKVNVRIIAATNKNLYEEVRSGRFREDLYYRLNVIEIRMPPLRERKEDIIDLSNAYLGRAFIVNGSNPKPISLEAKTILENYDWPGNVRELQNVLERAAILCAGDVIQVCDLPDRIVSKVGDARFDPTSIKQVGSLDEIEKEYIKKVLTISETLEEAASVLGINMSTLWRKRKKFGIE